MLNQAWVGPHPPEEQTMSVMRSPGMCPTTAISTGRLVAVVIPLGVLLCVISDSCATHPLSGNGTYRYSAFPSSCNFRLQQRQLCEPMREQNLNPSAIWLDGMVLVLATGCCKNLEKRCSSPTLNKPHILYLILRIWCHSGHAESAFVIGNTTSN